MTRLRTAAAQKRYTLLKLNSHTMETEQLTPRGPVKKTHPLKSFKSPADVEKYVLNLL